MGGTDKLEKALEEGTIDARDLRKLLRAKGAELARTKGSHETWKLGSKRMTLATHGSDLKPYQIKNAKEFLK